MAKTHKVTMLGTGLIGRMYTETLHGQRNRDSVAVVFSQSAQRAAAFAAEFGIPHATTDLRAAIEHPAADTGAVARGASCVGWSAGVPASRPPGGQDGRAPSSGSRGLGGPHSGDLGNTPVGCPLAISAPEAALAFAAAALHCAPALQNI